MKIYKEYYVSVKPDSELAYVLPLTGSEKKISEQKAKGEGWAKSRVRKDDGSWEYEEGESFAIPNEPTSGYEIIGFSDRYSTSNKHIYLKHPKGFHFEMAIETFIEMLKETTIEHGVIKEDLIIYTYKGKNALCVYGGELYNTLEEDGVKFMKLSDIKEGDVVSLKGVSKLNTKVTYIGKRKLSADLELSYNRQRVQNICTGVEVSWWKTETPDIFVPVKSPEKESHLFLVETDKVKNIVGYLDEKKIRIVSVVGNNTVDDSIVAQIIGDKSYLLSCLLGSSGWTQQRNKIISENGWQIGLGYRATNSIDVSLKKVYVEKV